MLPAEHITTSYRTSTGSTGSRAACWATAPIAVLRAGSVAAVAARMNGGGTFADPEGVS